MMLLYFFFKLNLGVMFQAEEEALMLQSFVAGGNTGQEMENRLRPYISQVLMVSKIQIAFGDV